MNPRDKKKFAMFRGLLSPRGWLKRAAIIVATLVILHLLGWRADTKIISGTSPPKDFSSQMAAVRGVIYGLVYFAAVVGAPILMIAAGLFAMLSRRPSATAVESHA